MIKQEKRMFYKDEEKDINLLLSRVKKDPTNFKDKIAQKLLEFNKLFEEVKSNPKQINKEFCNLCMFFGQIFELYPKELQITIEALMHLFNIIGAQLENNIRYVLLQTLFIVQKKGFIDFLKSFIFFIKIFELQDKKLRKMIFDNLVQNIKNLIRKKKFYKLETQLIIALQEILMHDQTDQKMIKRILKFLMRLYYKRIWTSKKLVNLIAQCIKIKNEKCSLMVAKFLIQTAEQIYIDDDSDQENENLQQLTMELGKKYKYSKKKIQKLEQQIKNVKKKEKRLQQLQLQQNIYPIDMIYNPSQFIDLIQEKFKSKRIKFALKIELLCLMGRLIGRYKMIYPSYYQYVMRFIRTEIKNPERLFAFIAESIHDNSNLEDIELLCKKIISNFIADGIAEEKITIGINTVRQILLRKENALEKDDVNYICKFKFYKNKSITAAARGFINTCRDLCPQFLDKEFKIFIRSGMVDQKVSKESEMQKRIKGAELLGEDNDLDVENQRILTDEDFKKIKRIQKKQIMDRIKKETAIEENQEKAIDMPQFDIEEMKKQYEQITQKLAAKNTDDFNEEEVEDLLNQMDEEYSNNSDDQEENQSEQEEENDMEIEISDDQNQEESEESIDSEELEMDDDIDNNLDEEEQEMQKRGFITSSMINTYSKKVKYQEKDKEANYQQMIEKKFSNRKKSKKGSKTNKEKQKQQPYMMVINKINKEKSELKQLRKRVKKIKKFKGHTGRKLKKK